METKHPRPRPRMEDIVSPTLEDLIHLALRRMRYLVAPDLDNNHPPPLLFPLAESMRGNPFTVDDWDTYGDLESEYGRLTYLISVYPERGAPFACEEVLLDLLQRPSLLTEWPNFQPTLIAHAQATVHDVVQRMVGSSSNRTRSAKSDYVAIPVDYKATSSARTISLQLWKRSLGEMASQLGRGHFDGALAFLQIHAFLKDPIYGLSRPFSLQQFFFSHLLGKCMTAPRVDVLHAQDLERLAAQAAQEASYLANPLLQRLTRVHFNAHHQLPYVNVPLNRLARAEFSVPMHVLEVMEEMLGAVAMSDGQACPLVPILVATYPRYAHDDQWLIPIIDGNHRAIATLLLRFLATLTLPVDRQAMLEGLRDYCTAHHLGQKWQIDLYDVVTELHSPTNRKMYDQITSQAALVRKFAWVKYIPALVVQEDDFYTICKQRSAGKHKPVLLHPYHQALFNDDDIPIALPQKAGQTHGRPEPFRLMSLTPFGGEHSGGVGVDVARICQAKVRPSMNGLAQEPQPHEKVQQHRAWSCVVS
ncbi:hypothetical protein BDV30DRAFT_195184 [Aspergillus minisclerotigenes]|uniref:Uncharacterized protein n=1 Tax=Aspergillus minisclerotigenes TaxID=656917 RepID=A0A5N6ISU6_9EURO|nr:hypothetical protein BDV30DRAFT_195184 [Aspergillus minisclerotigenes]